MQPRDGLGHDQVRGRVRELSQRSSEDPRQLLFSLSVAGKRKLEAGTPLWEAAQAEFEAHVGAARAARLRRDLLQAVSPSGLTAFCQTPRRVYRTARSQGVEMTATQPSGEFHLRARDRHDPSGLSGLAVARSSGSRMALTRLPFRHSAPTQCPKWAAYMSVYPSFSEGYRSSRFQAITRTPAPPACCKKPGANPLAAT